jgi:hypothetical protein
MDSRAAIVVVLVAGACTAQSELDPQLACNGSTLLCDRRIDRVAFATAHNAMSNAAEKWELPNQNVGLTKQLELGVRGFMMDLWIDDRDDAPTKGQTMLCHGSCVLGSEKAADGFKKFASFLDAHPHEVLVFVIEDHVDESAIAAALKASGLDKRLIVLEKDQPLATLRALVQVDRRVLLMTESGKGKAAWNHAYETWAWDTPYSYKDKAEFTCAPLRGKPGNPFYVVNHFITNPFALEKFAKDVNTKTVLGARVKQCRAQYEQVPNLVAVDFADVGDLQAVVKELNGL